MTLGSSLALLTCPLVFAAACVSEGTRPGTEDTAPGDGVVADGTTGDGATGPSDEDTSVIADSGGGDGADGATVCGDDSDCLQLGEGEVCHEPVCANGRCELEATSGGDCDDGNACTEGDFCDHGVCAAGVVVDCTTLSLGCWTAMGDVCDPASGCPGVAQQAGVACNDGIGAEPGVCVAGWEIPIDQCDGQGHCLDASTLVPKGDHPLAGKWFALISTAPTRTAYATLRSMLVFGGEGSLLATEVDSTDDAWTTAFRGLGDGSDGRYCSDISGRLQLERAGFSYVGGVDPSRTLMIFGSHADVALGAAIRPIGSPAEVSGRYAVAMTTRYPQEDGGLMTRIGSLEFESGCITNASLAATAGLTPEVHFESVGFPSCFVGEGEMWRLEFILAAEGVALPTYWIGAIGEEGDTLLLSNESDLSPEVYGMNYGTIIASKSRNAVVAGAEVSGRWSFVSQRGGVDSVTSTFPQVQLETGTLEIGPDADQLEGKLNNGSETLLISGDWWFTSESHRYHQRATFGRDELYHTAFLTPTPTFMFGWVVRPPNADRDSPQILLPVPREGSLFVAIRRLAFEDLYFPPVE